jgi:hypothetical protein
VAVRQPGKYKLRFRLLKAQKRLFENLSIMVTLCMPFIPSYLFRTLIKLVANLQYKKKPSGKPEPKS